MKTRLLISRFIFSALLSLGPLLLSSQVFEKQPDPSTPHFRFAETSFARQQQYRSADPVITAMVGEVNPDTLRKTLRQLQDWGSRCLLKENHKEVATWLMNKFRSYGYTDVRLDSFYLINTFMYIDSSWQYNVICTLQGSSAPDEINVIGGHYDSFSVEDPLNNAPGVDDNGTSVAATLEIARVMAAMGYQPESTIQFTLFAAEELGLYGSSFDAQKAKLEGKDIRFMFNIDMIANNPGNVDSVLIYRYPNYEWACFAAASAIEKYTPLSVVLPPDVANSGSDSYPYWLEGFPSVFFQEITFSPYIHSIADTVGNCNVPYFSKVTGGVLAALAEQQTLPIAQELRAESNTTEITLRWKPTANSFVKGYTVYRSDSAGGPYQKISPAPVSDSVYHDLMPEKNKQYYYVLTTVNDSSAESGYSNEVTGVRFNFSDTLLVLASLRGTLTTPDSVYEFYRAVLDTIPFTWHDLNTSRKVSLGMLSRYRSILWIAQTSNVELLESEEIRAIESFTANGGNLLFAGLNPLKFWMNSHPTTPYKIPETGMFRQLFKVDSVDRKIQSMMSSAYPVSSKYESLNVDSLKYMQAGYPGEIFNIDVFAPAPGAAIIYRFDSKHDSTTIQGRMKHRPVGLEYMGTDFKSILLSFPLWYVDTNDAREFLHYVMSEKFIHTVGIEPSFSPEPFSMKVYPNPVTDALRVTFTLDRPGFVKFSLVSIQGKVLDIFTAGKLDRGIHSFSFQMGTRAPGLYQIVLQTPEGGAARKIIKFRQ